MSEMVGPWGLEPQTFNVSTRFPERFWLVSNVREQIGSVSTSVYQELTLSRQAQETRIGMPRHGRA
jgi:hypothetical protein